MNGAHGKLALPLVEVGPRRGTELICLLNMVVLIVQEMTLNTKVAMTIFPAQVFHINICAATHKMIFRFH